MPMEARSLCRVWRAICSEVAPRFAARGTWASTCRPRSPPSRPRGTGASSSRSPARTPSPDARLPRSRPHPEARSAQCGSSSPPGSPGDDSLFLDLPVGALPQQLTTPATKSDARHPYPSGTGKHAVFGVHLTQRMCRAAVTYQPQRHTQGRRLARGGRMRRTPLDPPAASA